MTALILLGGLLAPCRVAAAAEPSSVARFLYELAQEHQKAGRLEDAAQDLRDFTIEETLLRIERRLSPEPGAGSQDAIGAAAPAAE